jgi:exonuclease SbcD
VVVAEKPYAGLREAIADALPNALEVRIDGEFQAQRGGPRTAQEAGLDRGPTELFAEFLAHRGLDADPRLGALFAALLDRADDDGAGESPGVDDDIPLPA